ncbi:MAG TPA: hypothetical protein VJU60_13575 [Thermoleophilaceae bacterium]|nr:hypothetical protein [Thermoleophilaceae bacterium]
MDHLAIPVTDQERSRRGCTSASGSGAAKPCSPSATGSRPTASKLEEEYDEPDYVSVKCRDPDGYIVEASWEPG